MLIRFTGESSGVELEEYVLVDKGKGVPELGLLVAGAQDESAKEMTSKTPRNFILPPCLVNYSQTGGRILVIHSLAIEDLRDGFFHPLLTGFRLLGRCEEEQVGALPAGGQRVEGGFQRRNLI